MKLNTLSCPACDAPLDMYSDLDSFFCPYCGRYIVTDELTDNDVKVKRMRHKERMQDKYHEEKHASWLRKEKTKERKFLRFAIVYAILIAAFVCFFSFEHIQSNLEEQKLQRTVTAIEQDIKEGDYVGARNKTNSLYYTSDWSNDIEEKWDATREQLLKEIDKAEKEANKQSIFDWYNGEDEEPESESENDIRGYTNSP